MIVKIESLESKQVRLPDFLIVGAARSGTSSLFYYLRQHPNIFMPSLKEPQFFSFMDYTLYSPKNVPQIMAVTNLTEYGNLFDDAKQGQVVGEASTSYLYIHEKTIKNIKDVYGPKYKNLKIIIILRNPTERTWSHYVRNVMDNRQDLLEKGIKSEVIEKELFGHDYIIEFGMYYEQVKSYIEEFPNVKIWLLEDLSKRTKTVIEETFLFLGVDESFKPDIVRMNVSGKVKFKKLYDITHVSTP